MDPLRLLEALSLIFMKLATTITHKFQNTLRRDTIKIRVIWNPFMVKLELFPLRQGIPYFKRAFHGTMTVESEDFQITAATLVIT
jgi:hypothetical protein